MANFQPSKYQSKIFDWIDRELAQKRHKPANLVVEANPGSGKTTTLVQAANRLPVGVRDKAIFVAFNKHIATELQQKLPQGMQAKTLHGVGYSAIVKHLKTQRGAFNPPRDWVNGSLNKKMAQDWLMENKDRLQLDSDSWKAVADSISKLVDVCQLTLTDWRDHDAIWDVINHYGLDELQDVDMAITALPDIFRRIVDECHKHISFGSMVWLPVHLDMKLWQYDVVFADECQDFNAVQRNLVKKLTRNTGFAVWVGDPHQCQPAGTLVRMADHSLKPIEQIQPGDKVVSYHRKNGYYRPSIVTGTGFRQYTGLMYRVSVNGKKTEATDNHKWLVRWANMEAEKQVVYLMRNRKGQYRIGHCQLFTQINSGKRRRGKDLGMAGRMRTEDAEAGWILKVCDSNTEAFQLEQILSAKHGIPQVRFHANGNERMNQDDIQFIHDNVQSAPGAEDCLLSYGLNPVYPLVDRTESQQRRGGATAFITQSCNLMSGYMEVPAPGTEISYNPHQSMVNDWQMITVDHYWRNEPVYSLEVKDTHFYIADGILTHNSIYGFAFASTESVDEIIAETQGDRLPLSICYRCPTSHVALAGSVWPEANLEPRHGAPEGEIRDIYDFQIADNIRPGNLVVSRVNAPLIPLCFRLIRDGIGARVKGRDIGANLKSLLKKIEKSTPGGSVNWEDPYEDFANFKKGEATKIIRACKGDEDAADMALANLGDKLDTILAIWEGGGEPRSTAEVERQIDRLFADEGATVWLSTIHKAKGLEADDVYIVMPSKLPHPMAKKAWEKVQEENMRFIAYSRAKQALYFAWNQDEPGCPAIPLPEDMEPEQGDLLDLTKEAA